MTTNSVIPVRPGTALAALIALVLAGLSFVTHGSMFFSAMLGIAAWLVFSILLWVAVNAWPAPAPLADSTAKKEGPTKLADDDSTTAERAAGTPAETPTDEETA